MRRTPRVGGLSLLVAFVVLQFGTWFAMTTAEISWVGSWPQAIDNAVGTVVLVGPLLAGLVAVAYASLRKSSLGDLVVSSARPVRGWADPALRLWLAAVASLVLAIVLLTVRAFFLDVPTPARQFMIVPVGILVLTVHALIGVVVGLHVPPRAAALVAAIASFGLFILATDHLAPPSFITGGVTGSMFGEQYRLGSIAALCVFAALSFVAIVPWAVPRTSRRRPVRSAISVFALAGVIGLAQFTWPDLEARLEPGTVSYRCAGSDPEVCVFADRPSRDLAAISRRLGELSTPLRDIGVRLPAQWRQEHYGTPGEVSAGTLIMSVQAETGGRLRDQDLVRSLVEPATCPQYPDGNEPELLFGARVQILNWLSLRNKLGDPTTFPAWFSSPESEVWVRTTYAQLSNCNFDAVRKP